MKLAKRLLMRANGAVRRHVFGRPAFIRTVFGVEVVAPVEVQTYCEWPSVLLRLVVGRYVGPGDRVLDVGTGAHALLAIHLKRRLPGAAVVGTDILAERIDFARRTADRNGADVSLRVADMFRGVEGRFDLVLINPPAIPSGELAELGFQPRSYPGLGSRRCWSGDGGNDGLDIIRRFLDGVAGMLTPRGRAVMAVNPSHCSAATVRRLCRARDLSVLRTHCLPGVVNAYVLAPATPATPTARAAGQEGGRRP